MTVKEYLQQYTRLDREINHLLEEQQRWKDLALRVTPGYEGAVSAGSPDGNRIPTAVERIAEWEEKINRKVDQLVELREEIEGMIGKLKSADFQTLLRLRYINGYTWERIAVEMHYSYQWVCKLHGRALLQLKQVIESDTKM